MNIPYKYAVECVCDKIAAAKCYKGREYGSSKVLKRWQKYRDEQLTNEKMKCFFDKVFQDLIDLGEKTILTKDYMKKTYEEMVNTI